MNRRWYLGRLSILAVTSLLLAVAVVVYVNWACIQKYCWPEPEKHDVPTTQGPGDVTASEVLNENVKYYDDVVRPLLAKKCARCHGPQKQRGGLRVDTVSAMLRGGENGPAVVPKKSGESLLLARIKSQEMPEGGPPLTADETERLQHWIDQGAAGPKDEQAVKAAVHWAFQPARLPAIPSVKDPTWAHNPIDAFLASARDKAGVPSASPPAAKSILLRRLHLDLTGLPPTAEDYQAFLKDPSPFAYELAVDKLLASPQYAERWARHWMDVWRYSSYVERLNTKELMESDYHIWRWRDWIIKSLYDDKGYNRMILEMLAGDELGGDDNSLAATGFLVRHFYYMDRNLWVSNAVDHTAKAFLGISMGCARCHDHKFDPISQKEYYQFRAFFEPYHVKTEDKKQLTHAYDKDNAPTYIFAGGNPKQALKGVRIEPHFPESLKKHMPKEEDMRDYKRRRLALALWLINDENPLVARVAVNQVWSRHFGKGLVANPVEFGLRAKPPVHPELLDYLAVQFRSHNWSMKWLHRLIVTSRTYQMDSSELGMKDCIAADRDNRFYWRFPTRRMEAEVVRDSILFLAGNLDAQRIGGPDVDKKSADTSRRRSIYLRATTLDRIAFLDTFDGPKVEDCYRRTETIVPQQALALMNNEGVWGCSELIAGRLSQEKSFVAAAFQLILGRPPSAMEEAECQTFLTDQVRLLKEAGTSDADAAAHAYLVHALFNHNDFVTMR